jgi:predicted enzyme related to lactoylglutathione lyase
MKTIEIAFSFYPVTDMARARKFYEETLNLEATRVFGGDDPKWIEYDIGPGTIAVGLGGPDWKPSAGGGCVALEVEDFNAAMLQLEKNGHKPHQGPFETPVCHMALVADPDGNSLMIHKRKSG